MVMRSVHGFQDQWMDGMVLGEQDCMVRDTVTETVLIQNLNLVLIFVRQPFLLVIDAQIQRLTVEIVLMVGLRRPSRGTHMGLLLVLLLVRGTR